MATDNCFRFQTNRISARLAKSGAEPSLLIRDAAADPNLPRIGGSFGGFIAVVVVLASIFLFSCIAVFFLLRDHHRHPHPHARPAARSTSTYDAPIGPPGMRARIARLFGRHTAGGGWVRADSRDDEWDAADDMREHDPVGTRELQAHARAFEVTRGARALPQSDTAESVTLSAPSPPPSSSVAIVMPEAAHAYADPFSASPTHYHTHDEHRFSVQSGEQAEQGDTRRVRSMRKLNSGTKFVEGLGLDA